MTKKMTTCFLAVIMIFNLVLPAMVFGGTTADDYNLLRQFLDSIVHKVFEIKETSPEVYDLADELLREYLKDDGGIDDLSSSLNSLLTLTGVKEDLMTRLDAQGKTIGDVQEAVLLLKDWSVSDRYILLDMIAGGQYSEAAVKSKAQQLIEKYMPEEKEAVPDGGGVVVDPPVVEVPEVIEDGQFADTKNHWAAAAVKEMTALGFVKGYEDGTFKPENKVSRCEFTALVVRLFDLKAENTANNLQFKDIKNGDWYTASVQAAYQQGIINGKAADAFKPMEQISRQEMAVIMIRALEKAGKLDAISDAQAFEALNAFTDGKDIADWAKVPLGKAVKLGLLKGRTATGLVPGGNLTRAEAVTILQRVYGMM